MEVPLKAQSHAYSSEELQQLGVEHKVRIVDDTMVGLDRAAKHVRLAGGGQVPYDYLVLAVWMPELRRRAWCLCSPLLRRRRASQTSTSHGTGWTKRCTTSSTRSPSRPCGEPSRASSGTA